MVLRRYISLDWYYSRPVVWSKSGVLRRDGYKCAYCGRTADTIDHLVPVSKGGVSSWDNCIACCRACNLRKADRTPDEAGMILLWHPKPPRRDQLVASRHR